MRNHQFLAQDKTNRTTEVEGKNQRHYREMAVNKIGLCSRERQTMRTGDLKAYREPVNVTDTWIPEGNEDRCTC
jgi:hypothetical protein